AIVNGTARHGGKLHQRPTRRAYIASRPPYSRFAHDQTTPRRVFSIPSATADGFPARLFPLAQTRSRLTLPRARPDGHCAVRHREVQESRAICATLQL